MDEVPSLHEPEEFLDYDLPERLIAQTPAEPRDSSRLLVVERSTGTFKDRVFSDLPDFLSPGDLIVANDSRVIPARIAARRQTGGRVEFLLLQELEEGIWEALARPLARLRPGELLTASSSAGQPSEAKIEFIERRGELARLRLLDPTIVEEFGQLPLPPYIKTELIEQERYQTMFAASEGSAAAPTAGLHFTPRLLDRCRRRGIDCVTITLHVGVDTFRPLEFSPEKHKMHSEWFDVPASTWESVRATRSRGGKVLSIGTTVTRVLETVGEETASTPELSGRTSIFIRPPHQFKVVDAQITNFHLPRTTLLLMIGAFTGGKLLRRAYEHAIEHNYRFYSFGDAMLIV